MIGSGPTRTIEKSVIIRKIKRVHRWAKFVGILYLLATLAIAAIVALVPTMEVVYSADNGEAFTLNVFSALKVFQVEEFNTEAALKCISVCLYGLLLLTLAINALRCLFKLGKLFRLRIKWVVSEETFNDNVEAMEGMGKMFSGSFASSIIFLTLIYMILGVEFTSLGLGIYALLGAGFVFYFLCACISRRAIRFYPHPSERQWPFWPRAKKESSSGWVAFIRNLMRLVLVTVLLFLFTKVNNVHSFLVGVLTASDMATLFADTNTLITFVLNVLVAVFIFVQVGMATSQREYYLVAFTYTSERLDGSSYTGVKRFLVVSIFGLLLNIGLMAWTLMGGGDILIPIFSVLISVAICFIPVFISAIEKREPQQINLTTEMGTVFNNYGYGEM